MASDLGDLTVGLYMESQKEDLKQQNAHGCTLYAESPAKNQYFGKLCLTVCRNLKINIIYLPCILLKLLHRVKHQFWL